MIGSILQRLEGDELEEFERVRLENGEAGENDEHEHDLEKLADERYDGITGRILKRETKRLRKSLSIV